MNFSLVSTVTHGIKVSGLYIEGISGLHIIHKPVTGLHFR